jgi:colanic acid/amylovoran biosynthesis protein
VKVLVLWADENSANLGVRALAEGTAELARRAWGQETTVDHQDFGAVTIGTKLSPRVVVGDIGRANGLIKSGLREYDVILDTGAGDSFTDIYGIKRFGVMAYVQRAARRVGVPVVLTPQTIGPFSSPFTRYVARGNLRRSPMVMSRDQSSAAYADRLGRPVDLTATDVVFALPMPEVAPPLDVVLNVSGLLWQRGAHVDSAHYRRTVHGIIDTLLDGGREISLMAHVLDNDSVDNDIIAMDQLMSKYGDRISAIVPEGLHEARSSLAAARIVVGSRMHACLNALSVGTPSVPLAYSRKFEPLMKDIGWHHTLDLRTGADVVGPVVEKVMAGDLSSSVIPLRARAEDLLSAAAVALSAIR